MAREDTFVNQKKMKARQEIRVFGILYNEPSGTCYYKQQGNPISVA